MSVDRTNQIIKKISLMSDLGINVFEILEKNNQNKDQKYKNMIIYLLSQKLWAKNNLPNQWFEQNTFNFFSDQINTLFSDGIITFIEQNEKHIIDFLKYIKESESIDLQDINIKNINYYSEQEKQFLIDFFTKNYKLFDKYKNISQFFKKKLSKLYIEKKSDYKFDLNSNINHDNVKPIDIMVSLENTLNCFQQMRWDTNYAIQSSFAKFMMDKDKFDLPWDLDSNINKEDFLKKISDWICIPYWFDVRDYFLSELDKSYRTNPNIYDDNIQKFEFEKFNKDWKSYIKIKDWDKNKNTIDALIEDGNIRFGIDVFDKNGVGINVETFPEWYWSGKCQNIYINDQDKKKYSIVCPDIPLDEFDYKWKKIYCRNDTLQEIWYIIDLAMEVAKDNSDSEENTKIKLLYRIIRLLDFHQKNSKYVKNPELVWYAILDKIKETIKRYTNIKKNDNKIDHKKFVWIISKWLEELCGSIIRKQDGDEFYKHLDYLIWHIHTNDRDNIEEMKNMLNVEKEKYTNITKNTEIENPSNIIQEIVENLLSILNELKYDEYWNIIPWSLSWDDEIKKQKQEKISQIISFFSVYLYSKIRNIDQNKSEDDQIMSEDDKDKFEKMIFIDYVWNGSISKTPFIIDFLILKNKWRKFKMENPYIWDNFHKYKISDIIKSVENIVKKKIREIREIKEKENHISNEYNSKTIEEIQTNIGKYKEELIKNWLFDFPLFVLFEYIINKQWLQDVFDKKVIKKINEWE